jgi:hypothetical protein
VQSQSGIVTTSGVQSPLVAPASKRRAPATLSVDVAIRSQLTPDVMRMNRLNTFASSGKVVNGNLVKSARFEPTTLKKTANVINESVMTAEDGKSVLVKAQLTKPGSDYNLKVAVAYVEEADPATAKEVNAVMTLGSSNTLDLPLGNKHALEIKYQNQTVVNLSELPIRAWEFKVDGRAYEVTTSKDAGRVAITTREIPRQLRSQ